MTGCSVAVTGASGFAAKATTGALVGAGYAVCAITRRPAAPTSIGCVQTRQISDYSSRAELARAIRGSDCVIHLADRANRRAYTEANANEAAINASVLIEAMRETGIRRVIVASSVYAAVGSRSLYSDSKRAMEQQFLTAAPSIEPVILRLPPIYGPGGKGMTGLLARAIGNGIPLPFACATEPRPFLDVRTLADLVAYLAGVDDETWRRGAGNIYEPADGRNWSLHDLAEAIGEGIGRKARLLPVPGIDALLGLKRREAPVASLADDLGWMAPAARNDAFHYLRSPRRP